MRGDNVTRGYFGADQATAEAFEGGWFHTGDVGEVDAQGRLFIRGRKKEMIVTPEGLNVFPEDVERVIDGDRRRPRVGGRGRRRPRQRGTRPRRAWSSSPAPTRRHRARREPHLLDHQKIRGISVWPGRSFPAPRAPGS